MNKKVKAYFLVFASLFAISCSNDGKIITVKNELNLDRKFETVEINLKEEKIVFGNNEIKFEIDPFKKKCLLEGLDDIALSLEKSEKIASFEAELKNKKPWIFND